MRRALALGSLLLLACLAACAGPRLTRSTSTAQLPAPIVRRVDAPARRMEGTPWPILSTAEATVPCDT